MIPTNLYKSSQSGLNRCVVQVVEIRSKVSDMVGRAREYKRSGDGSKTEVSEGTRAQSAVAERTYKHMMQKGV